jgi:hypothetical protein
VSGSNFNPRNTLCIPGVKIFAFLGLEPRLNVKYEFNWAGKIKHFSKVSNYHLLGHDSLRPVALEIHPATIGMRNPG